MAHLRVLVADDDPALRALWTRLLEAELGAEVVTAGDGAAAIALLCEGGFDLLVTDLRMPRVSGMDVLRYARARWPHLPALLVTGEASPLTVEEARRLGVEVLAKPFRSGHACELITGALGAEEVSERTAPPDALQVGRGATLTARDPLACRHAACSALGRSG